MKKNLDGFWLAVRCLIGGLFAYAGLTKLIEPVENFQAVILDYEVLPYAWAAASAYVLPWIELVFGVFLFSGFLTRLSALVLSWLSLSFVGMIAASYLMTGSLPENCGCFGTGWLKLKPLQVIFLDLFMFLAGLRFFLIRDHAFSLDAILRKR